MDLDDQHRGAPDQWSDEADDPGHRHGPFELPDIAASHIRLDPSGCITEVDRGAAEILDDAPEALVSRRLTDWATADRRHGLETFLRQVFRHHRPAYLDTRLRTPSQGAIPVRLQVLAIHYPIEPGRADQTAVAEFGLQPL